MADPAAALDAQLANIDERTGRSLAELARIVRSSERSKHGELRDMLERDPGMGHGDANPPVHHVLAMDAAPFGWLRRACDAAA